MPADTRGSPATVARPSASRAVRSTRVATADPGLDGRRHLDRLIGLHRSGLDDPEVGAEPLGAQEAAGELVVTHADPELEARLAGFGHLEHDVPDEPPVADARGPEVDALRREVLAEGARRLWLRCSPPTTGSPRRRRRRPPCRSRRAPGDRPARHPPRRPASARPARRPSPSRWRCSRRDHASGSSVAGPRSPTPACPPGWSSPTQDASVARSGVRPSGNGHHQCGCPAVTCST